MGFDAQLERPDAEPGVRQQPDRGSAHGLRARERPRQEVDDECPGRRRVEDAEVRGPEGPIVDNDWTYRFLRARANSIEGGTTEILRNIVAERVLGMPRLR